MATDERLDERMERIASRHGISLTTSRNRSGSVFTTPEWTDWPDEMIAEMQYIARKCSGPQGDYWREKD